MIDWLGTAGFEQVDLQIVEQVNDVYVGRRVLNHPFLKKNSCSQLALLSDEAYQAGIAKIENAILEAEARGETIAFRNELFIHMLTGYKPVM